ncbi:MAG: methylmalonyl-CoA epimerase [Oligoflexia bacterium]|nr:methylmalonyl-CoA epimerase [Oligoflexia bacterium]
MKSVEIEIDHIGIAVPSLDADSYTFWKALGFQASPKIETVSDQKVKVGMLPLVNDAQIELLEPTSPDSPVAKFLAKKGPGIHHICLRVKDIRAVMAKLKDQGVKLIYDEPVKGAHNCLVTFVHPSSTGGVLVELSQPGERK